MFTSHKHGGQLLAAVSHYSIPVQQWVDLSTGISPFIYPLPEVPAHCWQRLPEVNDGLDLVAKAYYGSSDLLAVAGSQEAITRLPQLRPVRQRVGILSPAYHSHQQAWARAGHEVMELSESSVSNHLDELDVLVVVNPSNPLARQYSLDTLRSWHQVLLARGGWLLIDEAYADAVPAVSLMTQQAQPGLIVLRSVGKYFGLAGMRLGFVWAQAHLLEQLSELQDDWSVSHLARWAGQLALADGDWQRQQRRRLTEATQRLHSLLQLRYGDQVSSAPLFAYVQFAEAALEYERLARFGILTRLFDRPLALRFGLPANEAQWERLHQIITEDE